MKIRKWSILNVNEDRVMKFFISFNVLVLSFASLLFITSFSEVSSVSADEATSVASVDEEDVATDERNDDDEEGTEGNGTVYEYVAQPGDSYTLLARKAVQTYGLKEDVSLSRAQIVFAETGLTQEAGSQRIHAGQNVTIDESDVAAWAERALDLSESQENAWAPYARNIDFNTDSVGEAN